VFIGMLAGAIIYLSLPATQTYYRLYSQGLPAAGPPFGSYLAQDYVGYCSGVFGLVGAGMVLGLSRLLVTRLRTQ
jgi:hypothetical protein